MSKHTKGPWAVVEGRTHGSIEVFGGDTAIAEIWRRGNAQQERAIAHRIVACVNACEGFSIEELEGADLFDDSIESQCEIIELKKRRDELLAQVEQLQCQLAGCGVAAMQNTRDSTTKRAAPGDYGYSASYEEVCLAVDREMAMREQRDELLATLIGLLGEAEAIAQVMPAYGESQNIKNARAAIAKAGGEV